MQTLILILWAGVVLGAFVLYPKVMLGLFTTIVRGTFTLLADTIALLFAWI